MGRCPGDAGNGDRQDQEPDNLQGNILHDSGRLRPASAGLRLESKAAGRLDMVDAEFDLRRSAAVMGAGVATQRFSALALPGAIFRLR